MKILILGHGRHGKDTFAELLGLEYISSSEAALDVIWPALKEITLFAKKETAFEERHEWREIWKELISLYNTPDKSSLAKLILSKNDVYVGMRCIEEFEASEHLFDVIYYVDASKRVNYVDPTMSIPYDPETMVLIDNNGDLASLDEIAARYRE